MKYHYQCTRCGSRYNHEPSICPTTDCRNASFKRIPKHLTPLSQDIHKPQYTFEARGVVLGNFWGGGRGGYPARKLSANTKENLKSKIEAAFKDGSLDSGMGYASLTHALMVITQHTHITVEGKTFHNQEEEDMFLGFPDEDTQEFLYQCLMNYQS